MVWPLLLGLLALLGSTARAGNLPGELPALVGRLHVLAGDVQLQDRDSGQWQAGEGGALNNWPLAAGDRLRLGPGGRAELRIGSSTLRLDAQAQLWLQQLDEQGVVLQLQAGSLALRLASFDGDAFGPVEVRTREGRWLPQRPGHYRFDRETDATQASVWRGELQFEGHDSALVIPSGRRADLWLDPPDNGRRAATRYAWAPVQRDAFADWVARDERLDDAPVSARHVPPGITGWQDLDRHGDWVSDAEQGPLWLPRVVAPGWAPYQVGRWAWVAPWGWTWIDAAPWGFAPFHYGSWVSFGGRWAWSPGPRGPRVRYAPALSAWIGGPSVGVTVQIGGPRPPPPRVVVPVVPVVVVRPGPRPYPAPVVVGPRPGWHGEPDRRWDGPRGERRGEQRRDDWRDDRRDDRRDERRDERRDGRPEWRGDNRPDGRPDNRPDGRPDNRRPDQPRHPVAQPSPLQPAVVATPAPVVQPVVRAPETPRMTVPRPVMRPLPAADPAGDQATPRGGGGGRDGGRDEGRADRPGRGGDNGGGREGPRGGGGGKVNDRDLAR